MHVSGTAKVDENFSKRNSLYRVPGLIVMNLKQGNRF